MSYESKIRVEVSTEVHTALRELKQRGESFNDVLKRVLGVPEVIVPEE